MALEYPQPPKPRPGRIEQSVNTVNKILQGPHLSFSSAMLSTTMADALGMGMHNAVNQQANAQMLNSASTTSACARILNAGAPIPFNTKPMYGSDGDTGTGNDPQGGAPLDLRWPCKNEDSSSTG